MFQGPAPVCDTRPRHVMCFWLFSVFVLRDQPPLFFFLKRKDFFPITIQPFVAISSKKPLNACGSYFGFLIVIGNYILLLFFLISSEICQLTTDPMLCVNFLPPFLSSKSEEKPSSEGGNVSLVSLIALCFWCPEIVTHYFLATRFAR